MSGLKFTTAQMCELTGINADQLRHWRKVISTLAGRDGRASRYDFREILALATMAELAKNVGMPAAILNTSAPDIFAIFANADLKELSFHMYITSEGVRISEPPDWTTFAIIRPDMVYRVVRQRLAYEQRIQLALPI